MNRKIYIVSCDDYAIWREFSNAIGARVPKFSRTDYNDIKFSMVAKIVPSISPTNIVDLKLIDDIDRLITKYNDGMFQSLLVSIEANSFSGVKLFIRVDNIKTMNKLKRIIKRPNYKTVRINNTKTISTTLANSYSKYRFDSVIDYINDKHLMTQVKLFIKKHVNTIKFIHD